MQGQGVDSCDYGVLGPFLAEPLEQCLDPSREPCSMCS